MRVAFSCIGAPAWNGSLGSPKCHIQEVICWLSTEGHEGGNAERTSDISSMQVCRKLHNTVGEEVRLAGKASSCNTGAAKNRMPNVALNTSPNPTCSPPIQLLRCR